MGMGVEMGSYIHTNTHHTYHIHSPPSLIEGIGEWRLKYII